MSEYDPNYIPKKDYALIGQKAVLVNTEGKILLMQRSEKSGGGGKWSLPGGALEHGEEPFSAMAREISEETQLHVENLRPFYLRTSVHDGDFILVVGYTGICNSNTVTLNWEHDAYKWLSYDEALQLDLTGDARFFIEHFTSLK